MRHHIKLLACVVLVSACGSSSSNKRSLPPPAAADANPGPAPAEPVPVDPEVRVACLEQQKLSVESLGWNPSLGVAGLIDLLLAQSDEASLPRCL